VRLRPVEEEKGWLSRHVGISAGPERTAEGRAAAAAVGAALAAVEERAWWALYGL